MVGIFLSDIVSDKEFLIYKNILLTWKEFFSLVKSVIDKTRFRVFMFIVKT